MPHRARLAVLALTAMLMAPMPAIARDVVDALGRKVTIPETVTRVICSGSGALRLLTYLDAAGMAVAVDDIETRKVEIEGRPYALAHPEFRTLPVFGEFRGRDNPERILTLDPAPQVILKTSGAGGFDPVKLQERTGIPVVVVNYGNLDRDRAALDQALRLFGEVVDRKERAEAVIRFFDDRIADLKRRADTSKGAPTRAFVGGVAYAGARGFQSTEPGYLPFALVGVTNVAGENARGQAVSSVAKEKIVEWNPDVLFVDLAGEQLGEAAGSIGELKRDPSYRTLTAVAAGKVYGLLPYNWYTQNFGSVLANAYFVGKLVHPQAFADVDPRQVADDIYRFLVGQPVFDALNRQFGGRAYVPLAVQ